MIFYSPEGELVIACQGDVRFEVRECAVNDNEGVALTVHPTKMQYQPGGELLPDEDLPPALAIAFFSELSVDLMMAALIAVRSNLTFLDHIGRLVQPDFDW